MKEINDVAAQHGKEHAVVDRSKNDVVIHALIAFGLIQIVSKAKTKRHIGGSI